MTAHIAPTGSTKQLYRRPWLPWLLLAASLVLVTYSVKSFLRLPQQLGISQQCRMSRMRPAYIDHTANLESFSPSGLWRKYRLYLYRERDFEPMDLPTGSPALFVPGNSGSYGQVRSVASSAARQFYVENGSGARRDEWKDAPPGVAHTDWYTIDFNEDFSAFSGSTLIEQATFINEVVAYLTNRYASPATHSFAAGERNTTVPILAHSMGGIAARLAGHLPNRPIGSIDTIITLSTPHAYPPVPFDRSVEYVYSLINQAVSPSAPAGMQQVPPLLISIAGGLLDTQLPSDPSSLSLARIGESVAPSRISTYTGSLPSLWSSVDHLAVMWCDQLREKIARGVLLDMMAFGRVSAERNAGGVSGKASVLRRRRELWRRALSMFGVSDAGNGEIGPLELVTAPDSLYDEDRDAFVVNGETPTIQRATSGPDSALATDAANLVFRIPAKLGESDQDLHAFELITNLCVGWNPSSGMGVPIPQPIELVVQMCTNSPDSFNPVGGKKTSCQLVMPWQWELIPPSLLPRTDILMDSPAGHFDPELSENRPFPTAEEIYHVPGFAFQRLRLESDLLTRQQIDWIRVERKTDSGIFVHQRGLKSFVRGGWMRQAAGRVEKHGGSTLLTPAQDSAVQQHHQDHGLATTSAGPIASEWSLKGLSSSLLARRIEIVLSQCLIDNLAIYTLNNNDETQHSTDPSFSPFMHVSDRATGDSRWYPQLVSSQLVRKIRDHKYNGEAITFTLSLHGNAPFMPLARDSVDEVRVQLWSDHALLRSVQGKRLACNSPVDSIRLSVDWKASAGLILLRYRFFLAAWPLGLLVICVGLSWLAWTKNPAHAAFPAPLSSVMQPAFRTPFLGHKIDPLLGLLGCLTGALLIVDSVRLALYKSMASAQSHGPDSSLLGMVLGLGDYSSSVGLVPCFLAVSYATLLVIVASIQFAFRLVAAAVTRLGLSRKLDWVGAATASSDPLRWNRKSIAGLALLLLSVVLFVPHQFVFLCMFLLQLLNTLRAQLELWSTRAAGSSCETRFHQHLSIFIILVLLLPQKASFLVTWVRNLASVGIKTPKTPAAWMDHNILDVAPIVVLVWLLAGGRMLEPPRSGLEAKAIALGFCLVGWYALVWGIRYTYRTYDAFNALCILLAFCHWRSRRSGGRNRYGQDRSTRRGNKNSDETQGMLDDQEQSKNITNTIKSSLGQEVYEMQAEAVPGQLPNHHLALPASITPESSTPTIDVSSRPGLTSKAEDEAQNKVEAPIAGSNSSADKMDDLIAEYLEVLDQYQQVRAATTNSFSRGYLKLSRAKIECGASRLSSNSYDSRLLAEVRATIVNKGPKLAGAVSWRTDEISVVRSKPDYSHLVPEDKGVLIGDGENNIKDIAAAGLRRRTGPGGPSEKKLRDVRLPSTSLASSPPLDKKEEVRAPPRVAMPDALLQFGGLPTISLRGAQSELKRALDQVLGVSEHSTSNTNTGLLQLKRRLDSLSQAISEAKV
ncbi:related to BST1 - negative regulator of COPII vesicle formation [Melanopsichium pennsylvanicum]|uniref:GPI inositol-deacylase n=2 Tax=Melanopsichium pennsylvanicum TaxID=63383 RepID=A0AAJ5C6P2_9BASI|nr:related to BST1-negative regulator of COPII vesicle formation [Melanopsichium pennsylvanicum 4]SNX85694.1 related to BST1 - negative regulator of COPII vesicle formation [Melanopsichium pennsylvanicum]